MQDLTFGAFVLTCTIDSGAVINNSTILGAKDDHAIAKFKLWHETLFEYIYKVSNGNSQDFGYCLASCQPHLISPYTYTSHSLHTKLHIVGY
jgi:hypothetical protein